MNMAGFLWKYNIEGVLFMNMNIKKLFYITSVIVVACVIASSVITVLTAPAQQKVHEATEDSQPRRIYVLTERKGRVTAYIKGVEVPYIETTTAVNSLPYDVQARLREGIEFETEEELRKTIDEYCS